MAAAKETPPYDEGRAACRDCPPRIEGETGFRPLGLNPYALWSDEYNEWDRGYQDAAHGELPVQRDGHPVTACDFCGAETNGKFCDPAGLYLEEGDLYACGTCWERWMAEDARDAAAIERGEEPS